MPIPPPANATVTVSKALSHTVTTATKHVASATHTATQPSLPHISLAPSTSLINILGVVGIIIALIAIVGFLALKRIATGGRSVSAIKLGKAVTDPSIDAVGLLLDIDTRTAKVVPLKEVENMYVTVDPSMPASIVVRNPHATRFTVDGKPLIIAPAITRSAIEVDAPSMTVLGLGQVVLEDPAWHDTITPSKSFEDLITKLSTMIGRKRGTIKLTPRMSLAFEMSIPKLMAAMLSANLYSANVLLTHMTDITQVIDRLAEQLGLRRALETQAKASFWGKVLIGVGAVIFIVILAFALFQSLTHGGR